MSVSLREVFLNHYGALRKRLQLRLGCEDQANDAMQEAWLRVDALVDDAKVEYPSAYLFRIAVNIAEDNRRREARVLSLDEVEALYDMADEMADTARIVAARSELQALEEALESLPRRRRAIVMAARVDNLTHREIAERFGVSMSTVENELRVGLAYCCDRLGRRARGGRV
ncbi:RNA polymerase sigma factor [Bordetella hinzii]|uniref:RNA polymerase sigma factor n=1 Tax=Bordetella hinzii TaxID=103855 RepID=UPI00045B865F|nr:RNA polymerase sigma factor [Bordetella hinzii]KCB44088.1 sigma-70, region 4 [Bordetella hinzii 5132]